MKMDKANFLRIISSHMEFRTARLCFILGAGASKECGIPTAKELAAKWFADLLRETDIAEEWKEILCAEEDVRARAINMLCANPALLDEVLQRPKWNANRCLKLADFIRIKFVRGLTESYSELFEYNYPNAELRERVVEGFIRNAEIRAGYRALANVLLNGRNNLVITTNFDMLIERAVNENYPAKNIRKMNHAGDDQCDAFRQNLFSDTFLTSNPPLIIKAHSEITRHGLINTAEEIRYLPDSFFMKLKTIFSMYIPIFIGYAGTDVAFVDMLLRYARSNTNSRLGCFWLIYGDKNENPEDMVNESIIEYVKLVGGKFVMHNGFEEIMQEIAGRILQHASYDQNHTNNCQNIVENPLNPREDNKLSKKDSTEDLKAWFLSTNRKGNLYVRQGQ